MKLSSLVVVMLITTLAGCIDTTEDQDLDGGSQPDLARPDDGTPFPEDLYDSPVAMAMNATADPDEAGDWFYLSAAAGPERPLAAFDWTVPEGAVFQRDNGWQAIPLEVVAVVGEGDAEAVDHFMLHAFILRDGVADHMKTHAVGVWDWEEENLVGTSLLDEPLDPMAPEWFVITQHPQLHGALGVDDEIFFVVTAESTRPIELGVALRVMGEEPNAFEDQPSADKEAFLAQVDGRPLALDRSGESKGYRYAFYMDLGAVVLSPEYDVVSMELWSDDAEWTEGPTEPLGATRPLLSARDLSMTFGYDVPRGWGFGWGLAMVTGGTGTWESAIDVHGHRAQASGVLASWGTALSGTPLYDDLGVMAWYLAEGEGEGGSSATFQVTYADVPVVYMVMYEHLDFGVTLDELLGVPGLTAVETSGMEDAKRKGPGFDRLPGQAGAALERVAVAFEDVSRGT